MLRKKQRIFYGKICSQFSSRLFSVHLTTHSCLKIILPRKHFLFSKTSSRRLEDVFSVTLFVFQDVFKTSSRRVCKTSCNYVFKTSSRRLGRQKNVTLKTSSRRLQDVFSTSSPRRMFAGLF